MDKILNQNTISFKANSRSTPNQLFIYEHIVSFYLKTRDDAIVYGRVAAIFEGHTCGILASNDLIPV